MSAESLRLARLLLGGDLPAARALAERIVEQHDAARRFRAARSQVRRDDAARQKLDTRWARAELRRAALARDGGCALAFLGGCVGSLHMHHLVGRHDERIDTVAMLCEAHHVGTEGVHGKRPVAALGPLACWCDARGYADAAAALRRRLAGMISPP